MREGWEITKLGAISEIFRGGSPRPIKSFITQEADGVNWIKIGDTEVGGKYIYSTEEKIRREGMRSSRYVEPGDFLLSNSMSFGRPYILKTDGCIHDGWLVIKKYDRTLIQDFLYYLLLSPVVARQFEEGARGSTVRNLNTDIVSNVVVTYPVSHIEQQRIVDILDREFAKIDALKANAEKSLQAAKDLFQATLEKELEPKEGWQMDVLETLCECITKGTTPTSIGYSFTECGVNFVKAETFTEYGEILNDKIAHISIECNNALERSKLKELDLLFSIAGVLGRVAIVSKDILPANTNQALAIIRLKEPERMLVKYLFRYFKSPLVLKQIEKDKKGSAQYNLSLAQIKKIPVCIPPQDELEQIVYRLDDINDKCSSLQQNYQKTLTLCDDLKQALLRKAFNGEL